MTTYKRDPLRSQARRDVLKAIGDNEIINKYEIVELTNLSPLTINSILREFRNYKIVKCHSGGMYALSGEGKEVYFQLLSDKRYLKKEYDRRIERLYKKDNENKNIVHTIYIDEEKEEDSNSDTED
jgi:predicted methyltransferase